MLAESTGQRRDGADAVRASVGEQADAERSQRLALSAARRLCEQNTSDEYEPKLIARRLEILIDLTQKAAESGDLDVLDQYLDGIASAGAQKGFCDADFFLASAETRRALLDSRVIDGSQTGLYSYWQVLRHAEDHFLRRVAAHLEAQRPADDRPTIALLEELPQALILIDEDARIHYANALIKPLFGLRPRDATGRSLFDLAKPRLLSLLVDATAFITATARIVTSPNEAHEDAFRLQNGSTYIRRSLPLKPEGLLRNLITVTDLTPPQCQPMPRTPKNARPPENRATERNDQPQTPPKLTALDPQTEQIPCARGTFTEHHRKPRHSKRPTDEPFPSTQWKGGNLHDSRCNPIDIANEKAHEQPRQFIRSHTIANTRTARPRLRPNHRMPLLWCDPQKPEPRHLSLRQRMPTLRIRRLGLRRRAKSSRTSPVPS